MEQDGRIGQGIISLEHVTKRFESAGRVKEVVDDVSLEVKENEFVVLFGPGQCGKTTMINLIAGLELVTEGTVSVDGKRWKGRARTGAWYTRQRRYSLSALSWAMWNSVPNPGGLIKNQAGAGPVFH